MSSRIAEKVVWKREKKTELSVIVAKLESFRRDIRNREDFRNMERCMGSMDKILDELAVLSYRIGDG